MKNHTRTLLNRKMNGSVTSYSVSIKPDRGGEQFVNNCHLAWGFYK